MAIGVDKLTTQEVNSQARDTGLVFDMAFLKDLQLQSGKTKEGFAQAINDWAEKQIDQDHEISLLKEMIATQGVDSYFDFQFEDDARQAETHIDGLKKILVDYLGNLSDFSKEVTALKTAINFTLTNEGVGRVVNGAMGNQSRVDEYYNKSGAKSPVESSSNSSEKNGGNQIKSGNSSEFDYGAAAGTGSSALNTIKNKKESKNQADDAVAYKYQSIYELDNAGGEDADKMSTREIIRKWFQGNDEGFIDIVEVGGSNKITRPDSAESDRLRKFFKQPLKDLVLKREVDLLNVWNMMEQANKEGKLSDYPNFEANKKYWEDNFDMSLAKDRAFSNDKKVVVESMSKLSSLYAKYKNEKSKEGSGVGGSYTSRLFGMIDNAGGVDGLYKFADSGLQDIVKANQSNVGEVMLDGGTKLLDPKDRDGKAERKLQELVGSQDIPNFISDDHLSALSVKKVLDASVKGQIDSADQSVRTLLKQYKGLPEVFDAIKGKLATDVTPDATLMLIEGKAFGASSAEVFNIKALVEKGTLTTKYGDISDATRMMNFFVDYNNNGKGGDAADHSKFSGAQLLANYRLAVNQLQFNAQGMEKSQSESQVVKNILNKIRGDAVDTGDIYAAHVIEAYNNNPSMSLIDMVKAHPAIIKYIQKYVGQFAADPHAMMFADARGSIEGYKQEIKAAAKETIDSSVDQQLAHIPEPKRSELKKAIAEHALKLYTDLRTQASKLSPAEQAYFNTFDLPSLEQNLTNTVVNALKVNPSLNASLGVGAAVDLTKNVQLNLSTAVGKDGIIVPGVGLGFKSDSGVFGTNVNATAYGLNASVFTRLGQRDNANTLSSSLKPLSYKTGSLTADAGASAGFNANLVGVNAGLHLQTASDRMKGIDMIAQNARSATESILKSTMDGKGQAIYVSLLRGDDKLSTSKAAAREEFKSLLKTQLAARFSDTKDTEMLDIATNNILKGLTQTERHPGDGFAKVSGYMANQWREKAVEDLAGKYELTALGMGIGVFLDPKLLLQGPIAVGASVSAWISRYNRGASHLTSAEGYRDQNNAEVFGIDNRNLDMSSIQFVDYLNGAMEASRGMVDINKKSSIPKLSVTEDQKFIKIPQALWRDDKNLTLKVVQNIQLGRDAEENILVPVSMDMRMVVSPEQDKATYVLNIGSFTTNDNDITLTRFKDKVVGVTNNAGKDLFTDDLDSIAVNNKKKNQIDFKILQDTIGGTFSNVRQEGSELVYTENGTEHRTSLNGGKIGEWNINGSVETGFKLIKKGIDGKVIYGKEIPVIYELGFEDTMKMIDSYKVKIESWENTNRDKVEDFIQSSMENNGNNDTQALDHIRGLLNQIPAAKAIVDSTDSIAKSKLVSYMVEVFALEELGYKKLDAVNIMRQRDKNLKSGNETYTRILKSNSGGIDIKDIFSRSDLQREYKNESARPGLENPIRNDLIGYTAFYPRTGAKNERGYSMTLPGYTRVLGGKLNTLDGQKAVDAKRWMSENIKNDEFAFKTILDSLRKKISDAQLSSSNFDAITPDILAKLLTDPLGHTFLDGCCLKLITSPVFYLLGECANESLGLQIKAITCCGAGGVDEKVVDVNMASEEYLSGRYMASVTNSGANAHLGKSTVFKFAIGGATSFGGNSNGGGPKEGDGIISNPGGGSPDNGGGTGSGPGGNGGDTGSNGTGGG